jgi:hypothetical protein
MGPRKQNGDFLENGYNDYVQTSIIYGDHLSIQYCIGESSAKYRYAL